MQRDGVAGQWVIEAFGLTSTTVREGSRHGHAYDYKLIVCTREGGPVEASTSPTCVLTLPLSDSRLPPELLQAYESARLLAIQGTPADFERMSVALSRGHEPQWHFRFYNSADMLACRVVSIDGRRLTS